MEACWHQNQWKIDTNCEKRFFDKSCSRCSGGLILEGPRYEVGIKNQSKIDQKLKPKMDCLLASIFGGFWWVLGGKLVCKIEPRAKRNRLKNASKKCWKKDAFWKPLGGGEPRTRHGWGWILGPPNYQFSKTTPHHSPQTTAHRPPEHLVTPCAHQRGGGFSHFGGILRSRSLKIKRSMKRYHRGLILRFFGQMGGPLVPGEGL